MLASNRTRGWTTSTIVSPKWPKSGTRQRPYLLAPSRFWNQVCRPLWHWAHTRCQGHTGRDPVHQERQALLKLHPPLLSLPVWSQPVDKTDHTQALPACATFPTREEKITDAVSQRECIDLVICGLEEKMRQEVKKQSEGKLFEGICKIIYCLQNSSTKPTKDSPLLTTTSSDSACNGVIAFRYSRWGRRGEGGRGGGQGGGNSGTPRAAWRNKLTNRPDWLNFRDIPLDFCAVCAKKGHMADDCRVPPDRQDLERLLNDRLGLSPCQSQGSCCGGWGGGRKAIEKEEAEEMQDNRKIGNSNSSNSKVIVECTRFSNNRFCHQKGQSQVRHTWKSTRTYWSYETSFGYYGSVQNSNEYSQLRHRLASRYRIKKYFLAAYYGNGLATKSWSKRRCPHHAHNLGPSRCWRTKHCSFPTP